MLKERTIDKIINRIQVISSCWKFHGSKSSAGYGYIRHQGKNVLVHRFMYNFENPKFPLDYDGINQLDHLCRMRNCCNPEHMEIVSNRENTIRGKISKLNNKKTSKYVGVVWVPRKNPWRASIRINGKRKWLGSFKSEEEAGNAYLKAVKGIKDE